ncbi:MAG: maleate cis-trans isomerase family protein [Candidatus Limnocylindria bacterium]
MTARVGVLVPSTNTIVERDFHRYVSKTASVHTARMLIDATTADAERRMIEDHLELAARDLATVHPDVVAFACTSAGASLGPDAEEKLVRDVEAVTGAPVVSTNAAVHRALRRVGASRVAVITPYLDELTDAVSGGIEGAGFTVAVSAGMSVVDPFALAEISPGEIMEFVSERVASASFDTLFVSCTNLRAIELREPLSDTWGVPVVTSNQATIDGVLDVLKAGAAAPGMPA